MTNIDQSYKFYSDRLSRRRQASVQLKGNSHTLLFLKAKPQSKLIGIYNLNLAAVGFYPDENRDSHTPFYF